MNYERLDLTMNPQEETRCRNKFRSVIKRLGSKTHFSKEEMEALLLIHYKLTQNRPMNGEYFRRIMFCMLDFQNDVLMDKIFSAFDRNNDLVISVDSWLLGMSVFLRGSLDERIQFCFGVYDFMGDGYIKRDHMFQTLKHSYRGGAFEDTDEIVYELIDLIMKKMDRDRDGKLSFQDYSTSVRENPYLLEILGYCLPSRPAVYTFMTTFTKNVSTMHRRKGSGMSF